jgi:hypothetical protein
VIERTFTWITRFRRITIRYERVMGASIPVACDDWAKITAAYRFFTNERVTEAEILADHFHSARNRAAVAEGPVFVVHVTTEFSFQRDGPKLSGITKSIVRDRA